MWLLFIPVPILNGTLREFWYKPIIGEIWSSIVGCLILSSVFLLYVNYAFGKKLSRMRLKEAWLLGFFWLFLTLLFEFGIGFLGGRDLEYMLSDYNILKGRLWPIVLVVILFSPLITKLINKNEVA